MQVCVCILHMQPPKYCIFKRSHNYSIKMITIMLWLHHFLLCGLYSLCHKGMPSNNICSVEDPSCNSFLCNKNGQLLLFSFTAPAACKNILEYLANWLIKYEGVQCITIFHRLHLALRFGCLILVTETVKRTDNGVQQYLNLLCDTMKMGNNAV